MFDPLVKRVTAPFRRKRCPECGHKVHETPKSGTVTLRQKRRPRWAPRGQLAI